MITGIPAYTSPIEQGVRCFCLRYYLVSTEWADDQARARARERATEMSATFIDARSTPFMLCECGQALDFTVEACELVM